MRRCAPIAVVLAACLHAAPARRAELRVDVPAEAVRDVARAVLVDRYHAIAPTADDGLTSAWQCFTEAGDRCVQTSTIERVETPPGDVAPTPVTRVRRHLELSVRIFLDRAGDDVIVRAGARMRVVAPGEPDDGRVRDAAREPVPIWVEREMDQTLAAIRARLGDDRDHTALAPGRVPATTPM